MLGVLARGVLGLFTRTFDFRTGKVMLMPEEKADTDYIMVATGTGIAPYRGFIRRLFTETTPAGEAYKGLAWLFLGVANSDALLYDCLLYTSPSPRDA